MTESTTRLWLLRHGRPEGSDCFRGRVDLPLSPAGFSAMTDALQPLPEMDRVLCSPLQRCSAFAQQWGAEQACPVDTDSEIIELDFGRWDGLSISEVWRIEPERVQAFWRNPYDNGPPEGEPVTAFEARVQAAALRWLGDFSGEKLLVVSHGGVMRVLLKWALALPSDSLAHLQALEIGYACLIELEVFTDTEGRHWPRLIAITPGPGDGLSASGGELSENKDFIDE